MTALGFKLSSEEQPPERLVSQARLLEEAGFDFAAISDHFHPWVDAQGESPFMWAVLGAIARETRRLQVASMVVCPLFRMHPAIVAQAAATVELLMPGRFVLGLGTGENLNEHIINGHWPRPSVRRAMLKEAVTLIRDLWQGGMHNHDGEFYSVENARLYSLPERPPPIVIAAGGKQSARLAAELSEGVVSVSADPEIVEAFDEAGGSGKPRYAEISVCWDEDEGRARKIALEHWPIAAMGPSLLPELALPRHFEDVAQTIRVEDMAARIVCGPDPEQHLEEIARYRDAGFDHLWIHQIGPRKEEAIEFYRRSVMPHLEG